MGELVFKTFKDAVQKQFEFMRTRELFIVDIGKNELWDAYLNSFPEGTNQMFRERKEYDCQSCKQFIRAAGHMVAVVNNQLVSIWDVDIDGPYRIIADVLAKIVKTKTIKVPFLYFENTVGTDNNIQLLASGETVKWEHFFVKLHQKVVMQNASIGTEWSKRSTEKQLFERAMEEISLDAAETVLELIDQKSLYRGEEHQKTVELFVKEKKAYDKVPVKRRDNYCWLRAAKLGGSSRIKNSVIGTLLVDISSYMGLNDAVRLFESKVAPTNYKRPTALITKGMIAEAQKKVVELGIEDSLTRRFAVTEDITVNNVLFADREAKKQMGVLDILKDEVGLDVKKFSKVEEVQIDSFVKDILPNVDTVELMFENNHINNLMSLIAPMQPDAKPIFQWHNNFSWAYNGEVTDSIKERVKTAGGNVSGILRCSLGWFNHDDLDIHVVEPDGRNIYYGSPRSDTSGHLDVDMNAGRGETRSAVENIVWTNKIKMKEGVYKVYINQFQQRESIYVGFDAEIEYGGNTHQFHYGKRVSGNVEVATLDFSKKDGLKLLTSLPSTTVKKTEWGVSTQQFHKVKMIMNSPNHWDGHKTGNRHVFFILDECRNEKKTRGFFNEFLNNDLTEHRKVFEALGSKLKVEESDNQLSGLGFSSTKKNSVLCKLTGSFSRTIKINF